MRHSESCRSLCRADRPHLYPAVQTLLSVPIILEARDGQQIHHKLLGADVQRLPREPIVRQGILIPAFPATLLSLASPSSSCLILLIARARSYVEKNRVPQDLSYIPTAGRPGIPPWL